MRLFTHSTTGPLVPALLLFALTLGGCLTPEDHGTEFDSAQDGNPPIVDEQAFASFELPDGATIRFYMHEDGSASVTEEGDAHHAAVSARPEFEEATVFDVYHALAGPDNEAPEALLSYHQAMLAEATGEPTIDSSSLPQGWLLAELESLPPTIAVDPCPGHVQNFVCNGAGSAYPGGPGCFGPSTGSYTWNHANNRKRRYRTGFCTTGTVKAVITGGYVGTDSCVVFLPLFGYRSGNYTDHTYNYWWSGPSGATPRSYSNSVEYISGAGFSWGVRDKAHTSSSCKI